MDWLFTWGGRCFGYRDGDALWTYNGRHVGNFISGNVFAPNGRYLGELTKDGRLISNKSKNNLQGTCFTPYMNRVGYVKCVDYVGYVMLSGYEDFPKLEK